MKKRFSAILILFVSLFMVYQHTTGLSWDFTVYLSGAEWFAGQGIYLEIGRPPLSSLIMASLIPFGSLASEYLYILTCSIISAGSALLLCRKYDISPIFAVFLVLNPFFLNMGTSVGTEALAMSTLLLAIYFFPGPLGGVFFGLSFLSRYPMSIFVIIFPLIADFRKPKRWLKQMLLFAFGAFVIISPWLAWNYITTGDPLFSIMDSYTQNVTARAYFDIQPSLQHYFFVSNLLTPLFIFGLIFSFKKLNKTTAIFLLIFLANTISYVNTPHKEPRYLFFILPSVAYFSALISDRLGKRFTTVLALLCVLSSLIFFRPLTPYGTMGGIVGFLQTKDCALYSNFWPFFNYFDIPTEPPPAEWAVDPYLAEGRLIAVHKRTNEQAFLLEPEFIASHNILYNDTHFYLFGNGRCYPSPESYIYSYRWLLASYGIECC
jgi:hypothetical protein